MQRKGSVFPDDRAGRPLPDDEVTPACGPPRDGDEPEPGVAERPHGGISLRGELARGGYGIVNIK